MFNTRREFRIVLKYSDTYAVGNHSDSGGDGYRWVVVVGLSCLMKARQWDASRKVRCLNPEVSLNDIKRSNRP